jgi:TRAP-type C4-dicarboxylate transport system permease small subunit
MGIEALRRLDARAARVEATLATSVLLAMVLLASAQALLFNLAERDVGAARALLEQLDWVDAFLQKGTLWLAFLGASLATHRDKHIAVDLVPRLASGRNKARVMSFAALGSGVIALLLAGVYFSACIVADTAVPFDYEVLGADGPEHVCDVAPSELGDSPRPGILCGLRAALALAHVPVSSGVGIAQLIAPLMFAVIGVRLLARGISLALGLGPEADAAAGPQRTPVPPGGAP